MALFPAYAGVLSVEDDQATFTDAEKKLLSYEVPEAMEIQLLASDTEEESRVKSSTVPPPSTETYFSNEFYLDSKLDRGNLPVSTLYYPGRPQYSYVKELSIGSKSERKANDNQWRRYYSKRVTEQSDTSSIERQVAYRRLLTETPDDLQLWEAYIDFQEVCVGVEGALDAAREAVTKLPYSSRLRERLYCLLQTVLSHQQYLEEIRNMLAKEKQLAVRTELWARLLHAVGSDADVVLRAALADTALDPPAVPRLIHAFGVYLRTAGLWERLVLAVELLVAMNFPPTADASHRFPPPPDVPASACAERRLLELEDKAINSGLPRHAVWARVERARAGAHWRPAAHDALDPQRSPLPHDVADLLLPLVGPERTLHLAVRLLLLVKVPMVPSTEHWARTLGESDGTAEALLPVAYALRRVPNPPQAGAARLLELLTEPPHYFSDDTGFSSWVSELWEACCAACQGVAREALLCWRLRWLHARVSLSSGPRALAEAARLRNEGRSLLKRLAQSSPLAFAEFARLELSASGAAAGGCERAAAAAAHALRAAIADADRPTADALYVARVVGEVSGAVAGECALTYAALRRTPPPVLGLLDPALREAALTMCEQRCGVLERFFELDGAEAAATATATAALDGGVLAALRPGVAEWARARVSLATPAWRSHSLKRLMHRQRWAANTEGEALRYQEECACELLERAGAAAAAVAPALARLFPGNAYINLVSAQTPTWRLAASSMEFRVRALAPPTGPCAALAHLLPSIARALEQDWAPRESERAVRAARRATSGAGAVACGGALWAARLECEARANAPRLPHALLAALQHAPHDKWLHVRGAAWCGGEASALADALLEKQLRLHALPDELAPLPTPTTNGDSISTASSDGHGLLAN